MSPLQLGAPACAVTDQCLERVGEERNDLRDQRLRVWIFTVYLLRSLPGLGHPSQKGGWRAHNHRTLTGQPRPLEGTVRASNMLRKPHKLVRAVKRLITETAKHRSSWGTN